MENLSLILNRRSEVEQEIARLKSLLSDMESELSDLDTAERVLSRLTGAKRPAAGTANEQKPAAATSHKSRGSKVKMPMPVKIDLVLKEAYRQGLSGLEPKDIAKRINDKWPGSGKGEHIGAIVWRMWKANRLVKSDDTSAVYSLPNQPDHEKPADHVSSGEQSAGLSQPSAQGGEPVREVEHDNIT